METTETQVSVRTVSPPAQPPLLRKAPAKNRAPMMVSFPSAPVALPDWRHSPAIEECKHAAEQLNTLFSARDFVTGHQFTIAQCASCGLAVTTPQPNSSALAAYYPPGYYGNPHNRRFPGLVESIQRALYARRVHMVESARGGAPGRVLDVGCGRGELLSAFRRRGWEVQGTELSDQAASYARQVEKVPVITGTLDEINFPSESFDAVTMWHVLEHVPNPHAVLTEIRRVLRPGGVFLVAVPDFGGWEARAFRDKWFHLDTPRHLTHFTRETLEGLLIENGFAARSWSGFAPEYDSFSFVQSALNALGLRHNLLYNVLRSKQAKVIGGEKLPRWQVLASVLLGAGLGLLSVPATGLAGLAGRAGTMTVLATRTG